MIHDHGTEDGPGLSCPETRRPDGTLRGACQPRRKITDSEIRLAVGRWSGSGTPPASGPWYVTQYSRDLRHDLAVGWYPTWDDAMASADTLANWRGAPL